MVTVERSIVIRRPIEEVYAFVVQPENVPLWSTLPLEVTKTSKGPTGLGTTARFDNNFLGRTLSATFEVTVFEPSTLFRTRTTAAPFPIENIMTFEQIETGTRMAHRIDGDPGAFLRIADAILARLGRSELDRSLRKLKALLERGLEPGSDRAP